MKNFLNLIIFTFLTLTLFSSCGNIKTPQEIIDDIRYFGHDEVTVINNTEITEVQEPNELNIVELIDPCGNETAYDEIIVRLSDNALMVFFSQNGGRLSLIDVGTYVTTDGTNCTFKVVDNNGILEVVSL
jgi:hypothetical protein